MPGLSTQLLVIGAGVTGLGIAREASLRGIKALVIDQGDIGQGTSGRFHGLLHSGVRYALSDSTSAVECAHENRILKKIVPHVIEDTGGYYISTPADPIDYPDRLKEQCQNLEIPIQEVHTATVLSREPLLNPRISRAFEVSAAAIDSFDLAHTLIASIHRQSGDVWLRHRLVGLEVIDDRVVNASVEDLRTGETKTIGAEIVINAAGPWAGEVAGLAGVTLPLRLGKGTMIAFALRLSNTVIHRCRLPSDGDLLVPIGTVCVLGTTDIATDAPDDSSVEPHDVDLLMAEGEVMIPGISEARQLRAWAGLRAFHQPNEITKSARELPRAFSILDHSVLDNRSGFYTILGGKLTTFRLTAQETIDSIFGEPSPGSASSAEIRLDPDEQKHYTLGMRMEREETVTDPEAQDELLCECELVYYSDLKARLEEDVLFEIDDLRRKLRLGMGPCQGAFCAYRASDVILRSSIRFDVSDGLPKFLTRRWRGLQPLAWGHTMRQLEFFRRIYRENLAISPPPETY